VAPERVVAAVLDLLPAEAAADNADADNADADAGTLDASAG
jgi:hypothetical protein